MRRIVRDYIASALDRQRGELDRFIAEHILYPDAFPLVLAGPVVADSEIAHLKIVPRYRADFPEIEVTALLRAAVTADSRRREGAPGVHTVAVPEAILRRRTLVIDVELDALGTAQGYGYDVEPQPRHVGFGVLGVRQVAPAGGVSARCRGGDGRRSRGCVPDVR